MTSHHKTNHIVCGESTCVQPYVHTALHEQMEPGVHLKAKVRPELPDEICEPSSSALKKNNQTQREEFLSWQSAIITEVLLSSPSRFPVLSLFYIPSAQTFLSHCIRGLFSGLLRAESEQHVGTGVRKPECRGATVSWWIPVLCPFRELMFPLTQLHKLTNEKDSQWALQLSIMGSMCTLEL